MIYRLSLTLMFSVAAALTVVEGQVQDLTFKKDLTQQIMRGDKTSRSDIAITLTADALIVSPSNGKGARLSIPYSAIKSMTYDRRSRTRVMAPTMGKRLQHFLTIQYRLNDLGDVLEIEMGKDVAPRLVAQLEARSGQKIERTGGGS